MGNYSPKNISAEVAHLITKLLQQNAEVCINTENVFEAVKFLDMQENKGRFVNMQHQITPNMMPLA